MRLALALLLTASCASDPKRVLLSPTFRDCAACTHAVLFCLYPEERAVDGGEGEGE